jgi:hypothetical protein
MVSEVFRAQPKSYSQEKPFIPGRCEQVFWGTCARFSPKRVAREGVEGRKLIVERTDSQASTGRGGGQANGGSKENERQQFDGRKKARKSRRAKFRRGLRTLQIIAVQGGRAKN